MLHAYARPNRFSQRFSHALMGIVGPQTKALLGCITAACALMVSPALGEKCCLFPNMQDSGTSSTGSVSSTHSGE